MTINISAVIPAYNAQEVLNRSIDSALAQSYSPIEILIVDDGSTDETRDVAKSYGDRVRVLHQPNSGGAAARNKGIEESRGDWIAFLDADDEWRPHHLENAVRILENEPNLRWYGAPADEYIHETGELTKRYKRNRRDILRENGYFDDYMRAFPPYAHFSTPTMIVHKSVFEEVGMFDIKKRTGHDVDLWFRIGLSFPKVGYRHDVAANIYKRAASLSYTKARDYRKILSVLAERRALAESMGDETARRVEPRIMHWVTRRLKAGIANGDIDAVSEIYSQYGSQLDLRWRFIARFAIAAPWAVSILSYIRNISTRKGRAFSRSGLRWR